MSKKNIELCTDILSRYSGSDGYLLMLKRDLFQKGVDDTLNDFSVEYILSNYAKTPVDINKVIEVSDWFTKEKVESGKWDVSFVPTKIQIVKFLGETARYYNCMVRYKQNMDPKMVFIPKNAVIDNFLVKDYNDVRVDFERYDRLATLRDSSRKIKEHQKEAIKFLLSRKKCVLADSMGLGKTLSLTVAAIEGNFDSILIICPASLKTNWKDELMWYVPEKYITIVDSYLDKTKPELEKMLGYGIGKSGKKVAELREEAKNSGKWSDNRFVIVNFDILDEFYKISKVRSKDKINELLDESPMLKYIYGKKSLIIIDEAHRLSNRESGRYKIIKDLIKRGNPDSIYLSTGTPITNNPANFFNLLQFLDDPITNDWNFYAERYCNAKKVLAKGEKDRCMNIFLSMKHKPDYYSLTPEEKTDCWDYINSHGRKITLSEGSSNLEELERRVRHIYLRRVKEDLNDMPQKRVYELLYDFTPEQQLEYSKLWNEYEAAQMSIDPDKELNKDLLEGAIYRKYCSNQMIPNTIKLVDKIVSKGEKVVIGCCYDEELYTLRDYYGDKCVIFNGKMSLKEKDAARDKFCNDKSVMVFIGNIMSAGIGLTLTSSHIVVFNTFSYSNSDNKQMEDRVFRIGQKFDCDIYFQMFRNTRSEDVWRICLKKDFIFNSVIKKEDEKSGK